MISGTLSFAVPVAIWFGIEMRDRGVLNFRNVLFLIAITLGLGWLAALSMWNVWLKKKMRD